MNKKQITQGTVGVVALLATMMGTMVFTPEQLDSAYYCTLSEEVGIFYGGISGTGLTGYPYLENRTKSVKCKIDTTKGIWIKLTDYLSENEISIDTFLNTQREVVQTVNTGKKYICTQQNCTEVINGT